MTPEDKDRYLEQPTNHDGLMVTVRTSLSLMCKSGGEAVRKGRYDALDFDLLNEAEAEFVKSYMDKHYPDVPYRRKWLTFGVVG